MEETREEKKSKMERKNLRFHFYDCHKDALFVLDTKYLVKEIGNRVIIDQ